MRGSFSNIHCKDLVELLEVKLTKMWVCPMTGCPSDLSTLSLQELVNYNSGFSPLVLVLIEVSACGLVVIFFICLFSFGGSGLPGDFSSLRDLERVVDFVCSAFG